MLGACLAGTLLLSAGCSKRSVEELAGPQEGRKATVTLAFRSDGTLHAAGTQVSITDGAANFASAVEGMTARTGATIPSFSAGDLTPSSTDETAVRDIWVLQYDMSTAAGKLHSARKVTDIEQEGNEVHVRVELAALPKTKIVAVANAPGGLSGSVPGEGSALSALDDVGYAVTGAMGSGIPADDSGVLPMRGESETISVQEGQWQTIRMPLYRLVSKVAFTIENNFREGYPRLNVTGVALRNVPSSGSYARITEATHASVRWPAGSADNFRSYGTVSEGVDAARATLTWYMVPNSRGKGTATSPEDKGEATAPAGQAAYCTYISVQGEIVAAASSPAVPVNYRIYLGGNNTDDYNVWSNEAYAILLRISSLPERPEEESGYDGFEVTIEEPVSFPEIPVEGWDKQ